MQKFRAPNEEVSLQFIFGLDSPPCILLLRRLDLIEIGITLKALIDGLTNRDRNDADEYNSMHVLEN